MDDNNRITQNTLGSMKEFMEIFGFSVLILKSWFLFFGIGAAFGGGFRGASLFLMIFIILDHFLRWMKKELNLKGV